MSARGLPDFDAQVPPWKILVVVLVAGTILGLKICGAVLAVWWGTLSVRVLRRAVTLRTRKAARGQRRICRRLAQCATAFLVASSILFCLSVLMIVGGAIPRSPPFRVLQATMVSVLVVAIFFLTFRRVGPAMRTVGTPIGIRAAILWLYRSARYYEQRLRIEALLPTGAVVVGVVALVVGALAPPTMGWAPLGDGVGMAGVRAVVKQMPLFKEMPSQERNRGNHPNDPSETTQPSMAPAPSPPSSSDVPVKGAVTTFPDPSLQCPPVSTIAEWLENAVPADDEAGVELRDVWRTVGRRALGCPDTSDGQAARRGNFWVVQLTDGIGGPALLLVESRQSATAADRLESRTATIVYHPSVDIISAHLDHLAEIWPRTSFQIGELQVFSVTEGGCGATVHTYPDPNTHEMPPPVFEIAARLAQGRGAVPFLREAPSGSPPRYVVGFASLFRAADGTLSVTTSSYPDISVVLEDGIAEGGGLRSDGTTCSARAVTAALETATALDAVD